VKTWEQDPNEKQDYRETLIGDTVASALWTITPAGPTLGTPTNTANTSTVRVSGIVFGVVYKLTAHVIGASGQEYERSCGIRGTDL
jgi:hypothetical protein